MAKSNKKQLAEIDKKMIAQKEEDIYPLDEDINDMIETDSDSGKVENPFVELRNLITGKEIDVKTILNPKQVTINHRLRVVGKVFENAHRNFKEKNYDEERIKNMKKCADIIEYFSTDWLKLIINKDGTSRKQFIDALHKGAEEAKDAKAQQIGNNVLAMR